MNKNWILALAVGFAIPALPASALQFGQGGPERVQVDIIGRATDVGRDTMTVESRGLTFRVRLRNPEDSRRLQRGDQVRVMGDLIERDVVDASRVQLNQRNLGGFGDRGRDRDDDDRGRGGRNRDRIGERGRDGGPSRRSERLVGTIQRINRDEGFMRLRTQDQRVVRVEFDDDTQFVRNRARSSVGAFTEGSSVQVIGRRRGDDAFEARIVASNSRAGWSNGAVGEVVSVDRSAQRMQVDFLGEVWDVNLRGATLRRSNSDRVRLDDLEAGDVVRVQGTAAGGSRTVTARTVDLLRGGR